MKKMILMMTCLLFAAMLPKQADAATKVRIPDSACQQGNDIYYSYSMGGLRMNLMKVNKKTHKKKVVLSNKYKGKTTNGFFNLNIKGNYIYAGYDIQNGTDGSNEYICKINLKKKTKKILTKGRSPVVIGKKIYFVRTKYNKNYFADEDKGIYVMNFSGKGIRKVCNIPSGGVYELGAAGNTLVYSSQKSFDKYIYKCISVKGKKLGKINADSINRMNWNGGNDEKCTVGSKEYYVSGGRVICWDQETQEQTTLVRFGDENINVNSFHVFGNVMIVRGTTGMKGYIYMIPLGGENTKILLKKYDVGE